MNILGGGHYSACHSDGGVQDIQISRAGERELRTDCSDPNCRFFYFKEKQREMVNPKEESSNGEISGIATCSIFSKFKR